MNEIVYRRDARIAANTFFIGAAVCFLFLYVIVVGHMAAEWYLETFDCPTEECDVDYHNDTWYIRAVS